MNQDTLEGQWGQIKGKIHERWGQLTSDDLQQFKGNAEQLVGVIQEKTGESRETVNRFIESLMQEGGPVSQAADAVRGYANVASERAQETAQIAMDQARAGYEQTEELIRKKPMESLAVCFGVGIVAGIVGGLLMRSK